MEENPGRKERKGPRAGETEQGRIKGGDVRCREK